MIQFVRRAVGDRSAPSSRTYAHHAAGARAHVAPKIHGTRLLHGVTAAAPGGPAAE
eukprot:CAMPEP_0179480602 /NCGR_PEP_ID=MMETSP0799-20121207/58535_1 /TAXON_ID=46947 /ORGANISM="Geminigera cryophila, Strain CCMP2564" /LENGTH=55 /DNA_ID=CAMNT_0021292783 /DNA_START=15 /DNA_END=179 /DNA_ORIENTATION=+